MSSPAIFLERQSGCLECREKAVKCLGTLTIAIGILTLAGALAAHHAMHLGVWGAAVVGGSGLAFMGIGVLLIHFNASRGRHHPSDAELLPFPSRGLKRSATDTTASKRVRVPTLAKERLEVDGVLQPVFEREKVAINVSKEEHQIERSQPYVGVEYLPMKNFKDLHNCLEEEMNKKGTTLAFTSNLCI